LDQIVEDLTEFSLWTWGFVLVLTGVKLAISSTGRDCSDPTYGSTWTSVDGVYQGIPDAPIDNCPDKSNGVWVDLGFQVFLQSLNVGLYGWALYGERWTMDIGSKSIDSGKAAHEDDDAEEFPQSKLDDRIPMRLLQSVSFMVSYGFAQKVAARRIYQDEFGGRYGDHLDGWQAGLLIVAYFIMWAFQVFIQSETVLTCTTVLALPPYVDETNQELAVAVANVLESNQKQDFQTAADALGLPVSLVKEYLESHYLANQEGHGSASNVENPLVEPSVENPLVEPSTAASVELEESASVELEEEKDLTGHTVSV